MNENSHSPAGDDADISRLYQQADRSGPPAHLDTVILAAARQAVAARPATRAWRQRWQQPLAAAAMLLLALGVLWQLLPQTPLEQAAQLAAPPSPVVDRASAEAEAKSKRESMAARSAELSLPAESQPPQEKLEARRARSQPSQRQMAADTVSAPTVADTLVQAVPASVVPADGAANPAPKLAEEAPLASAPEAMASMARKRSPVAGDAEPASDLAERALLAPAPQTSQAAAESALSADSAAAPATDETEPVPPAFASQMIGADVPAAAAAPGMLQPAAPAEALRKESARPVVTDDSGVQQALATIDSLRVQDRQGEAQEKLRQFHRQHADYPLLKLYKRYGRAWVDTALAAGTPAAPALTK